MHLLETFLYRIKCQLQLWHGFVRGLGQGLCFCICRLMFIFQYVIFKYYFVFLVCIFLQTLKVVFQRIALVGKMSTQNQNAILHLSVTNTGN